MNISTPISTLWHSKRNRDLIKIYSDSFEGRPQNLKSHFKELNVSTFHCDNIQPIHEMEQKDFEYIKQINVNKI